MLKFLTTFSMFFLTINNGNAAEKSAPIVKCGLAEYSSSYPWHIHLYDNAINAPRYICGGTLISQNIILTSAHCVTDARTGALLSKDMFSVAAGKDYRDYDDVRDFRAQLRKLKEVHLMETWGGEAKLYEGDIAVLVTDENLELTYRVQPICVDYNGTIIQSILEDPKSVGLLAGFNFTTSYTEKLTGIKCSYIKSDECRKQLPETFQMYLIQDKFCTAFDRQKSLPCVGNSGSGVVYKNPTDERYYLAGLLGLGPKADDYSVCTNSLSTNVTVYADKIAEIVASHIISCVLPPHPVRGEWTLFGDKNAQPGDSVGSGSVILLNCNKGYAYRGAIAILCTEQGTWHKPIGVCASRGSCVLPPHPVQGQWKLHGPKQNLQPGDSVAIGSVILFECNKDSVYRGARTILCTEPDTWNEPVGVCEKLCQAVSNRTSTSVICTKEFTLGDCAHPDEGTRAEFKCEPFYENGASSNTLRICHDGRWDQPQLICEPICGLKTGRAETLIIGGNNATEGDYPWHVALYYNQVSPPKYLCGGSLISRNVIISAAHCVTDVRNGNLLSKNLFTIAVGKYYHKYNDKRDRDAQFSELEQIYIMRSWRGETLLYQADIAILITKKVIKLSRRVQPVCMDFDGRVIQSVLQKPNPIGVVVGFGATKEVGSASEVLKEITLPYIPSDQCEAILPEEFRPYLNYDKFCSGYVNKSSAVCTGDSGGGLVFQSTRNNRYYLAGIVSLSPKSDSSGCDQNLYSLFTNVTQFVKEIIAKSVLHPIPV